MPNPVVFFDMAAGGQPVGRIEMEVSEVIADVTAISVRRGRAASRSVERGSPSAVAFAPQQAFGAFTIVSSKEYCVGPQPLNSS